MRSSHSRDFLFLYKGMFIPKTAQLAQSHSRLPGNLLKNPVAGDHERPFLVSARHTYSMQLRGKAHQALLAESINF